ncbi:hypothetical protein KL86CLO1_12399 [uncultured Eubacteriales bacterium]|uniref:Uncharacterized protein n=1 Tax=uncultured Eubacteriales bacterium TaxID=172733 RepID=A0A212K8S7_9FIRM|nr:hypothetical protein KL86CLO1_12399 [uncultured Eubacteriales bacterium]
MRNATPRINPPAAGTQPTIPAASASSMAGMSKDQTDAAIITPAAKPRKIRCAPAVACFLKKKTTDAPKLVIKNVKPVPMAAHKIGCIFLSSSLFFDVSHLLCPAGETMSSDKRLPRLNADFWKKN